MSKLEISIESAKKAYASGNDNVKQLFNTLWGKETFVEKSKIKSWKDCDSIEDIFILRGKESYAEFKENNKALSPYKLAEKTLETAIEVINEGWFPTFKKGEYRYYPYFDIRSGFVLDGSNGDNGNYTAVGAALLLETSEKALHAGKILIAIYKQYLTPKKSDL